MPRFPAAAVGLTGARPPRGERGDTAMHRRVVRLGRLPVPDRRVPDRNRQHGRSGHDLTGSSARHQENAPSSIERRKEARKALRWSGKSQKTPSSVIQDFHLCGTICGTSFLIYCFYCIIFGRRLHHYSLSCGIIQTGGRGIFEVCVARPVGASPHQSPILDSGGIFVWIGFIGSVNGRILSWRGRFIGHRYYAMSVFRVGFRSFRWARRREGER